MNQTQILAILIFDDVEVAGLLWRRSRSSLSPIASTDPPAFNVLTVAEKSIPVMTRGPSASTHTSASRLPSTQHPSRSRWTGLPQGDAQPDADRLDQASILEDELVLSVCTGAALAGEGRASRWP